MAMPVKHSSVAYELHDRSRVLTAGVTTHGKATAKVIKKQCTDVAQFVTDIRPNTDNTVNGIKNAASRPKSGTASANRRLRKAKTA